MLKLPINNVASERALVFRVIAVKTQKEIARYTYQNLQERLIAGKEFGNETLEFEVVGGGATQKS
jgi:hypothetical protein